MTSVTVSGYRTYVLVSCSALLERNPQAAHRIQDEFSEVISCVVHGEVFRRRSESSLGEMLAWLETDLRVALNEVAPKDHLWEVVDGHPQFVEHVL